MLATLAVVALFGVLLLILETFLPGGIAGVLGVICILASVAMVLTASEFASWTPLERGGLALGIIAGSVTMSLIWLKCFAVKFCHRYFTLETEISAPKLDKLPQIDQTGTAISELRPLGRAEIDGKRHDVRCEDGFAPLGAALIVTGHEPGNLIVRIKA